MAEKPEFASTVSEGNRGITLFAIVPNVDGGGRDASRRSALRRVELSEPASMAAAATGHHGTVRMDRCALRAILSRRLAAHFVRNLKKSSAHYHLTAQFSSVVLATRPYCSYSLYC